MRVDRRLLALLLIAVPLAALRGDEPAKPTSPRLQLAFGDSLSGALADSDEADVLAWKCAAVRDPFKFALSAVSVAHFPRQGAQPSTEAEFIFELVGGDVLLGSLSNLTPESLTIESPLLGELTIERTQLKRIIRRVNGGKTHFIGPDGLAGWTSPDKKNAWREEGGHLVSNQRGTLDLASCTIPARVVIEIELSWKQRADFSLHFGSATAAMGTNLANAIEIAKQGVVGGIARNGGRGKTAAQSASLFALEVWNRSLVLVRERGENADLAAIRKVPAGAGRLQVNLYFDQESGRVAAYSLDGKLLAKVTVPEDSFMPGSGVRLVNNQGDVRLEHLAVRDWVGELPTAIDEGRAYLQRTDGTIAYAKEISYDAASKEFTVTPESGEPMRVAAADVQRMAMAASAELPPCSVRATLYDGARMSGQLLKVAGGAVYIARPGVAAPLVVPQAEIRSLSSLVERKTGELAKGRVGKLETEGVRLDGVLIDAAAEPGVSCLAWHPQGSLNSSPLLEGISGRIVYRETASSPQLTKETEAWLKAQGAQPVQARKVRAARPIGLLGALNNVLGGDAITVNERAPSGKSGGQLLWLVNGDRIPCELLAIDDRGVSFKSKVIATELLPHDRIKAWERVGGSAPSAMDEKKRERLLTLPRMQRENPPTHLIEFRGNDRYSNGDFLRGRLESMDDKTMRIEVRLESKPVASEQVSRIIWLGDGKAPTPAETEGDAVPAAEAAEAPADGSSKGSTNTAASEPAAPVEPASTQLQAVRNDGVRLTFTPERVVDAALSGQSDSLGMCQVKLDEVDQLLLGSAIAEAAADLPYHDWRLRPAPDPRFVSEDAAGGGTVGASELAGQPAPDFKLDLLEGGRLELSRERGHVVVLDFWASWCGPCMQAMPQLDALAKEFEAEDVRFFAINLQEDRQTAEAALERLSVKPKVALDIDGVAAEKFAVTAIPQTVVIDRAGNVVEIMVGGGPDFMERLRELIQTALAKPPL